MRFALCVAVFFVCAFSSSVKAESDSCPDAEWVSFSMRTPYTAEVQEVVPSVWLPQLLLPCPFLGYGVGAGQLSVSISDGSAGNIALAHSICIALGYWPCVLSIIGIPLLWLETWYVAPITVLNAMDRDVRCAHANKLRPSTTPAPAPAPTTPTPPTTTKPPLAPTPPRREEPLPPPGPSPNSSSSLKEAPESPRLTPSAMAW